ncbi:MAG: hypothetical protein IJN92_08540 [Lachnospiraceae bacterium]|nr:hypothetical protein [Lachnospiraceae bacterium]
MTTYEFISIFIGILPVLMSLGSVIVSLLAFFNEKIFKIGEVSMQKNTIKSNERNTNNIIKEHEAIISSEEFENLLHCNNQMEFLYNYSEKCWNLLHAENHIFEVEHFSDIMPALIMLYEKPMVYVKYPTYKVGIFDINNSRSWKKIEELLSEIKNRSIVYMTQMDYIFAKNASEKMEYPYINEVMCLELSLKDNISCKNRIVETLKNNGYKVSVYPAYSIRGCQIEFLEENKYFRVI